MDRTSWIALIVCFVLLIFYQPILFFFFPEWAQPVPASSSSPASGQVTEEAPAESAPVSPNAPRPDVAAPEMQPGQEILDPAPADAEEELIVLSNEFIDVAFTNLGGAIQWVALKEHTALNGQPIILNEGSPLPILGLDGWGIGRNVFQISEQSDQGITYRREIRPGLVLERRYEMLGDYRLECTQTVYHDGENIEVLAPFRLSLGTMASIYKRQEERRFVGMAWHTPDPGGSYEDKSMTAFDPGFLGMGGNKTELVSDAGEAIQWAALKTQFFTLIVNMNDRPASLLRGVPQRLPELKNPETGIIPDGIRGTVELPGFQVNGSFSQKFSIYAGPKEDSRLRKMGTDEDRLMQFGIFGVISRPLLMLMNAINTVVHNYGISIILMTIILRSILWYPQTKANLSMKRMQTVAPLMKEIQEKHKEKPEKMNQEMMKLYQDYGVNPFGGCLPLLIQFPIFLGFYYMLLGSIELRHAGFLWIDDLAQPDTIFQISALEWIPIFQGNINPMPLVMAVTMYISMSITPQPAGVDNPMMKVMKFMPAMFLIFCYNFASALSLYWTMQNLLSIVQMKYNMKKEPPTLEALKAEAVRKKKARKERMKGFGMSARGKK